MKVVQGNIDNDGVVKVVCQECGEHHYIEARQHQAGRHQVMAHLNCGHDLIISINFRQSPRKATPQLKGHFSTTKKQNTSSAGSQLKCAIANVSAEGMAFFPYATDKKLTIGDEVNISFNLDDNDQTEINGRLEICHINRNDCFGAKFCEDDQDFKVSLLNYIFD